MPTQINKLNDKYFIVDCYHHRIIYSSNINLEIGKWNEVNYEFSGPHSIATDGNIYVVDNAGRHEVLVFDSSFRRIQTIPNVGYRPHKTLYTNSRFYVISSQTQTIYCYQKVNGLLVEEYHKTLTFLGNSYCRSIKVIDGYMYFLSGSNKIFVTNYRTGNFEIVDQFVIPNEFTGLIDVEKYNGDYYLTSMGDERYSIAPNILRCTSLTELALGNYINLYDKFSMLGAPYFMEILDGLLFLTEVGEVSNSILSVDSNDDVIIYHTYPILLPDSVVRRETYPR